MERPSFSRQDTDAANSDRAISSGNDKGSFKDIDEKGIRDTTTPAYDAESNESLGDGKVLESAEDIVTHVIHVEDDPSLSPWTFRMFFIGELTIEPLKSRIEY